MSWLELSAWCLFWVIFIPLSIIWWTIGYIAMEYGNDFEKAKLKYGVKDE
tara:strand:- start:675 stop:824 length:150 start_codon:yes stop_codon:yes gene_type:complete